MSVIEDLPSPEDGAHTAMIIPAVLDCMGRKLLTLKQWGEWILEKQRNSIWYPRAHTNGDLLQVFAALVASGFYTDDIQGQEVGTSSSDNSDESESDSGSDNGSNEDDNNLKE